MWKFQRTVNVRSWHVWRVHAVSEGTWIVENSVRQPRGVVAARALVQPSSHSIPIRLLNFFSESVIIYAVCPIEECHTNEIDGKIIKNVLCYGK